MTVIVTSTTCYYSMEYEPIVDEVYKDLNQVIYRINITSLTTEEVKRFRTYYAFKETPTIFQIKNDSFYQGAVIFYAIMFCATFLPKQEVDSMTSKTTSSPTLIIAYSSSER